MPLSSIRRFLKDLTLLLLSSAAALLATELFIRLFCPQTLTVPWADRTEGFLAPCPNVRGREFVPDTYDVSISFSSQRFRGQREYSIQPGPGVIRLAMLGDSATFGNGANDDQSYPFQLQSILQERLSHTSSVAIPEVINAGVGGTGTAEQALWYDRWVEQFRPQLVVLNVFCNDVDGDLKSGLFTMSSDGKASPSFRNKQSRAARNLILLRRLPGYRWLAQHSHALNLLRNAIGSLIDKSQRITASDDSGAIPLTEPEQLFRRQGLALMAAEVMWLEQRVRSSGARMVIAFLPCRESIYPSKAPWAEEVQWKSPAIVERLEETSSKSNAPFVDLTPLVRQRARQTDKPLYYDGKLDTHPNPEGYRAIAELVAQFLLDKGLFPLKTDPRTSR
jgi:lysophospholipase L1-like esterase